MTKYLTYALLTGVALSMGIGMSVPTEAASGSSGWSATEKSSSHSNTGVSVAKAARMFYSLGGGIPVLDITSIPAHAVVATEQEFIRLRTEIEEEVKDKIKERNSVTSFPMNSFGASHMSAAAKNAMANGVRTINGGVQHFNSMAQNVVDAKLSYVGILSNEATASVEEGVVGKGVQFDNGKYEIEEESKKDTYDLAASQQANWISTVGDLKGKEAYAKKRHYIQQEQAIRMLALAVMLRQNVEENVMNQTNGPIGKAQANYEESDVKKDLNGSGGNVEQTNDYNQSLRQYAYYSLIYDQLLSLEQQIMGLRLQAKGGLYVQTAKPLTDVLEDDMPKPAGGQLRDEAQLDADRGTGTRKESGQ